MGKKGSAVSASKRHPLKSAHSSGRVLRSVATKNNKTCSEPLNGSATAQPPVKKRKRGSHSSVRVLRSASKDKDEKCTEPLNDRTSGGPDANKRKGVSPSKVGSLSNSVRVLRSASKFKDETHNDPLNDNTAGEPAANNGKGVSTSKVASPDNRARVLRSASKYKNEVSNEPLNDGTVSQAAAKRRKSESSSKVRSPVSSARVLRSMKNEASSMPRNNNTAAQLAETKTKSGTPSKTDSSKIVVRVLRSATGIKDETCSQPPNDSTPARPAVRKRKIDRSSKVLSPKKEYLKVCQRVRYILNRMNYEQSLIQAYASEGWKGQSLEKIKPEKELERAKAEILRCKLRIREAFRNMDSLLAEGKLEESLFDSAGEISSEDIFCAVCASKDVTLQNDIILCDGACDRGFHQNCLNPPLLTEDIPPGDEGWFCPACVCKADCIDALNELQGSKLSIHDSWEKVFPEAASLVDGSKQVDASELPPDHIEDNDYNPALAERLNEDTFSAEDAGKVDDLGLPSEDSEDDDFDPAGPDSSEDQKNESNSEESDFTSDSDDFCAEIAKSSGQDGASVCPSSNVLNSNEDNSNRAFMEMELDQDKVLPVSSRRQVERLDYKKLYDEAYGKESSDSSDDEEWSGKEQLEGNETDSLGELLHAAKRCSRRASVGQQNNEHTQREQLHGSISELQTEVLRSNNSSSTARNNRYGPIISQKLKVHFEKDPYPSHSTKESLAQELGLTFNQVCRWFSSTRHYSRVASVKKEKHPGSQISDNNDITIGDSLQGRELNAGLMEKLTLDTNNVVPEQPILERNLNQCNKEDIPLSGTEIEMESYGKESSDSSDEEWSALSTPRKGRLQDNQTNSHADSLHAAKWCPRRALAREQNNEHSPQGELLHSSASEQQREVLRSNGSSSTTPKHHFGPIINQKLKLHFEKDPYPSRATKESLAQELGLTFVQVNKWFASTRHYSRGNTTKSKKHPENNTAENNNSTTCDSIPVRGPNVGLMKKPTADTSDVISENVGLMKKPTADTSDVISEKLRVQINLNEVNEEDIPSSQYSGCEERVIMTPTAISGEVGPPGYGPGENFLVDGGLRNTRCEPSVVMTPANISREVGPPGYGPGVNQGNDVPWNTRCEQRVFMSHTTISREVGPPGYGPGENQGNGTSWNMSCGQGVFTSPTTISGEVGPPGYGPEENQGNGTPWNTSCQQRMFMSPMTISREAGPPGYEPGGNQGNGALWNTSCEQGMFTNPMPISRESGPPGYGPGGNQGNGAPWNTSCEQSMFTSPMTIPREVGPPGYRPGESQRNGTSWNMSCEQRMFTSPINIPIEVGPPGYGAVGNQGAGGSWNLNCERRVITSASTISGEVFPPGYGPGESQGSGASLYVRSPQGRSAEKVEFSDEARKRAIQRELRKRQKFR